MREKFAASCYNIVKKSFYLFYKERKAAVEKISVLKEKCIKSYMQPPCRACENICPVGAFRWGAPTAACLDCGLCSSVCPTGAIKTRLDYEKKLTAATKASSVHLACVKCQPTYDLPCLGFITRHILFALAAKKQVRLDIYACRTCLSAVYIHLCREAGIANDALKESGRATIKVNDTAPAERKYSRRDFFRHILAGAREKFGQNDAKVTPQHIFDKLQQTSQKACEKTSFAAFNAASWAFNCDASIAAFHGDLALYSGCSACGFCVRLCPQGALQEKHSKDDFLLTFTPQLCTACGLCVARCPKNALRLNASPSAKSWRLKKVH